MDKEMVCKIHGITPHVLRNDQRFRCKKCCVAAVQKRRRLLKTKAIEYLGGECSKCSYSKCVAALEFHHNDPSQKDFTISSNGYTRSWEKVKLELDKCILVCSNCHREIHDEWDKQD